MTDHVAPATAGDVTADDATACLERLAAELRSRGFEARLIAPDGRPPWLAVRNPRALVMAEDVMAQGGWFWWPWADRIAPVSGIAAAAARIASVLREAGQHP